MSININNFSIDLGEVLYCTSLLDFSVDITDNINTITTSGTYFTENGSRVLDSLIVTASGYRLNYITTPSGNITLVAHASNDNNEFYKKSYELAFGYEVSWEEVKYWGPSKEVAISVSADNTATATNTAYFSTFFKTKNFVSTDLGAKISAEGSGVMDIIGYITPQSKYFMYGKTYTITVSGVKDFSGNTLSTKTYSFTIEDG